MSPSALRWSQPASGAVVGARPLECLAKSSPSLISTACLGFYLVFGVVTIWFRANTFWKLGLSVCESRACVEPVTDTLFKFRR